VLRRHAGRWRHHRRRSNGGRQFWRMPDLTRRLCWRRGGCSCVVLASSLRRRCVCQLGRRACSGVVLPASVRLRGVRRLVCSGRKPNDAASVDVAFPPGGRRGALQPSNPRATSSGESQIPAVQGWMTAAILRRSPLEGVFLKFVCLCAPSRGWSYTTSWLAVCQLAIGCSVGRLVWQRWRC
jgi:hypothetical protein